MTDPGYRGRIERKRAADDEDLRQPGSPLLSKARATFTGLSYFPVDEAWCLADLPLEPYMGSAPVQFGMADTKGDLRPAQRAGIFRFTVQGTAQALVAYRFFDDDGTLDPRLFVPFMDATTGTESYSAGRYLDIEPAPDGTWTLDFNLAYHPTCVYNPRFSCPITPAENRLTIRVDAGERLPEGPTH